MRVGDLTKATEGQTPNTRRMHLSCPDHLSSTWPIWVNDGYTNTPSLRCVDTDWLLMARMVIVVFHNRHCFVGVYDTTGYWPQQLYIRASVGLFWTAFYR